MIVANIDIILKYFPNISEQQQENFRVLYPLYQEWNSQINVISRKDIDELYERHVLHSLAIAKICTFLPQEKVMDVGTGGGFPGIPLAILFPETEFVLVDSIGKKIKVVKEIVTALKLTNVQAVHTRAEDVEGQFNFILSRAVTRLSDFYPWIKNKVTKEQKNSLANGVLYLKGGDLQEEIAELKKEVHLIPISHFFQEDFFDTKYILHIPL